MNEIGNITTITPNTSTTTFSSTMKVYPVIKVTVDRSQLNLIVPSALIRFAIGMGWSHHENYHKYSGIYKHPEYEEILIPYSRELGDYNTRVHEFINILSKYSTIGNDVDVAKHLYDLSEGWSE